MLRHFWLWILLMAVAAPGYAGVFGPLANFDVVNDTGSTAHGFEVDLQGIHKTDITSIFGDASRWPNMERYGSPTVIEYNSGGANFGVKITYMATNSGGAWSAGTPSGTLPVSPSDSCWPYGAPSYGPNYPCDHFGVSTTVNTPNVNYSWLVESAGNPNALTPVAATVPNPVWTVTPVPPVANVPQPPQVNVVIVAPQPRFFEFGEPRWVKVTATGTLQDIALEDLVAENAVIQKARTQVQLEWQLIQVDVGAPGSGQIDLTGVALDPGATGVVYRFEFYKYTGARDPATNEALPVNGDTATPVAGDLGAFIVAQNAGINFDGNVPAAPPLPAAPVLNASIAGATVGMPYSQVIDATPGNPGDPLTITVSGLPNGLMFDSASNSIVGTPIEIGTFPLTITVLDTVNGLSTTGTANIQVADSVITLNLAFDPATVGVPFSQKLAATGGYGAISYSISGNNLPAGLTLTGDTIGGTPTTAGNTSITVVAMDALGFSQVASALFTVTDVVVPPPPPPPVACSGTNRVISSANKFWLDIAGGLANSGQSVNYAPANQTTFVAPLTIAGGIQAGMLVSYAGTVDANGFCVATSMTIASGLSLDPIVLPPATVGSAYPAVPVSALGGVAPYTLSVNGLPAGLTFDGASISGTPATGTNGTLTITVSAGDSIGESVISSQTLTINPPAAITLGAVTLPAGVYGSNYSGSVVASGGVGTLNWLATGLPAGLGVDAYGTVSGIPTALGNFSAVFTVSDAIGQMQTVNATITISAPAIVISNLTLPASGQVGSPYSANVSATGGYGTLNWTATGLPPGVTLASNGLISGSPTASGNYKVALTVTDSLGSIASANGSVTISAAPVVTGCTAPAGAKHHRSGRGTITMVDGNLVTIRMPNGKAERVTVPDCATIEWHGAKAFVVGQHIEWEGYRTPALGKVATQVEISGRDADRSGKK